MLVSFNPKYKHYRKRRDEFKNVVLDLTVRENTVDRQTIVLDTKREGVPLKYDFKREANRFVKRLARQGAFAGFPIRDQIIAKLHGKLPRNWSVNFIVPPAIGGNYGMDNFYVTTGDLSELMYKFYWSQIGAEVNQFVHHAEGRQLKLLLPKIPLVMTQDNFLQMILPHERTEMVRYLERKRKWRTESLKRVHADDLKRALVLRLHRRLTAPKGMKYALVKITLLSELERAVVRQEYLKKRSDFVQQSLERGDFNHLPKSMRKVIERTGHVPEQADLTCHHIIPRSLGGANVMDNICWLSKQDHESLHKKYLNPLLNYLESIISEKREIYFEIPVPENYKMPVHVQHKKNVIPDSKKQQKTHLLSVKGGAKTL